MHENMEDFYFALSITLHDGTEYTDVYIEHGVPSLYKSTELLVSGLDDDNTDDINEALVYLERYTNETFDYAAWLKETFE